MNIQTVRNHVIVTFVEEIVSERFANSAHSGLIISSLDRHQTNFPRWAHVTHVGPDVKEVSVGDYALIEGGRWTSGFEVKGVRYWKTDEDQIIATADQPGTTY